VPYLYHTDEERKEMLSTIGVASVDELFDRIPEKLRFSGDLPIGEGKPEYETVRYFETLAAKNRPAGAMASFLGGGIYDHYVPSIVRHLSGRSEFYTAYTPYQAEVSQGTLQAIFEYQTLISRLTGMPVANASMYDGATAFAEAALMAAKITGRSKFLVAENVNPRYRAVLDTYAAGQNLAVEVVPASDSGDLDAAALESALGDDSAAVMLQTPNYFGVLESPWRYRNAIETAGALLVVMVDPLSLALFRPPGEYAADIVIGEGQGLGNDMNFGGPLLGFMACRQEYVRRMPGRLVSRTTDIDGRTAYTLTLQTREQHIRREKATSNICTNQGLLALRSTIYLSVVGDTGYRELARLCHDKAHRLGELIGACKGFSVRYNAPFFREFVVRCPVSASAVVAEARGHGILAGIPLARYFGDKAENELLVAVTEKRTDEDLKRYQDVLKGIR
jgi:glycine dehydrogenase subunit 1